VLSEVVFKSSEVVKLKEVLHFCAIKEKKSNRIIVTLFLFLFFFFCMRVQ